MLLKWSVEGHVMQAVISDRLVIKQTLTQKKIVTLRLPSSATNRALKQG